MSYAISLGFGSPSARLQGMTLGLGSGNELDDFEGDGEVPTGTNPPTGTIPTVTPQVFCTISELGDATILDVFAEQDGGPFNDSSYGGFKEARLHGNPVISRKLSTATGGVQGSLTNYELSDKDQHFRNLWGVTPLKNRKWDTYIVDHTERVPGGYTPYRIHGGIVRTHEAPDDFEYQTNVEGMISRHYSQRKREKRVPQNRLSVTEFPVLNEQFSDGFSPAIGYGKLSDEGTTYPQGVVKGVYVGTANLQTVFGGGAVSVVGDFYVFFGHAVYGCINGYITIPAWTADTAYLAGDTIRPTLAGNGFLYQGTAGTSGSSAPTFPTTVGGTVADGGVTWTNIGEDNLNIRYVIPSGQWGTNIIEPSKPGWTAATGSALRYVDYNGYRYTVMVVLNAHRFARSLREGKTILSANYLGIEDIGDGLGAVIESPVRIWQHFRTNFVENTYKTGSWFPVPTFGDYSLIDTDEVIAVHAYLLNLGLDKMAILFGKDGQQTTAFEAEREILHSADIELGENRHGQVIPTIENSGAVATASFHQQHDISRIHTYHEDSLYANCVRYRYGYRYNPNLSSLSPPPEHNEWISGLITLVHTEAVALNDGERVYIDLDLYGIRDPAVALVRASRELARAVGPELEGPVAVEIDIPGLAGVKKEGTEIELGINIGVDHVEGLGVGGYQAKKLRVREHHLSALKPHTRLVTRMLIQDEEFEVEEVIPPPPDPPITLCDAASTILLQETFESGQTLAALGWNEYTGVQNQAGAGLRGSSWGIRGTSPPGSFINYWGWAGIVFGGFSGRAFRIEGDFDHADFPGYPTNDWSAAFNFFTQAGAAYPNHWWFSLGHGGGTGHSRLRASNPSGLVTYGETSDGVIVPGTTQRLKVCGTCSTISGETINSDGEVRVYVDDVQVIAASSTQLGAPSSVGGAVIKRVTIHPGGRCDNLILYKA